MNKKGKCRNRILAAVLAVFCLTLLHVPVWAEEPAAALQEPENTAEFAVTDVTAYESADTETQVDSEEPAADQTAGETAAQETAAETTAEEMAAEPAAETTAEEINAQETAEETKAAEQAAEETISEESEEAELYDDSEEPAAVPTAGETAAQETAADTTAEEMAAEPAAETTAENIIELVDEEIIEEEETEDLNSHLEKIEALSLGMSGDEVLELQKALKAYGYLSKDPNGTFDSATETAVKKFQFYNGLEVTGVADEMTIKLINEGSSESYRVLWVGSYGFAVYSLQRALFDLGYLPAAPDAVFGRYTKAALIAFQAAHGLETPDGGFGNWSFERLINDTEKFETLKTGDQGNDVKVMQNKLYTLGFLAATPDGTFGWYSESAVKIFQMYNGIDITGEADAFTLNAIYRSENKFALLSKGSYGTAVYNLQVLLKDLGYLNVEPDGGFGNYTLQAVKIFQKANGIYADGMVGKYTLNVLLGDPVSYEEYRESVVVEYGGTYFISTALSSSYAAAVADASVSTGANIQLSASSESTAQKWVMQNAGDGYYYIRNLKSWKCLDVSEGNVQQTEADSSSLTQKWKIVKNSGGGYLIENASGGYLTVSGGTADDEVNITAEEATEGSEQIWYMEETNSGTALDFKTDGTQYIGIRSFSVYQGNVTETTGYYNIQTSINLPSGGYSLSGGDNYSIGLKVAYVNSYLATAGYLGAGYYNYNRYDGNTVWAVKQFQGDKGLTVDGIVGLNTWKAMGYSEYDFYNLGSYTTALKVYAYGSSRSTYVQAMLSTAAEYAAAGTGFMDGASGKPGTYVDCSGLIYQCLYAAGINPTTNIIDHARVVYEYTSAYLGSDWKMGTTVYNAEPGDLIFYGGSSINHVAIYAGGGMIYDSWPGIGVSYRGMYSPGNIIRIIRVF